MKTDSPKKRRIVSRFFYLIWRALKAATVLVYGLVALLIVGVVLFALVSQSGPKIPESGALLLNPAGTLVEQKDAISTAAALQIEDLPQQTLMKDVIDALALAKDDKRIKLVVLQLDKLGHGLLPKLERFAAAIEAFKTSGKKVIAVGDNYSQSALFIAAHADEVLMNPEGIAIAEGFAIYQPYFKSFLEKHDVTVNTFKVGKYKSAVDPFLRDNMSEEDREAWVGILDPLWDAYTNGLEKARGLSAGSINTILENAPEKMQSVEGNLGLLALEEGLIDRFMTDAERREYLMEVAGEDTEKQSYRRVGFNEYLRGARPKAKHKESKIAVITAVGNIIDEITEQPHQKGSIRQHCKSHRFKNRFGWW